MSRKCGQHCLWFLQKLLQESPRAAASCVALGDLRVWFLGLTMGSISDCGHWRAAHTFLRRFSRAWNFGATELGIWEALFLKRCLTHFLSLQRGKMTEASLQVVSGRVRTETQAPVIPDLSSPLPFYWSHRDPSLMIGSGHWVYASSQFPLLWQEAVEWNVRSFSWHSKVLRRLVRTSLGEWGGCRMTVRGCFDSSLPSSITADECFTQWISI